MALAVSENHIPFQDYLEGEEVSGIKHEYIAGQVYAMSGGTVNHNVVGGNFYRHAGNQLSGKSCRVFNSDFKIRVNLGNDWALYYPDASIVCSPLGGKDQFSDTPTVILEVLSPSTRREDEVRKLRDYLTIPSLEVYLIAEADFPKITVYRRVGGDFRSEVISDPEGTLALPEVGISIAMSELYRDVEIS